MLKNNSPFGLYFNGRDVITYKWVLTWLIWVRFINVEESNADDDYRQMIIQSTASDIVYTAAVSGVSANFLRPSLEAMGITEELWENPRRLILEVNWMPQKPKPKRGNNLVCWTRRYIN